MRLAFIVASKEESLLFLSVSMQVYHKLYGSFLTYFYDLIFDIVNFRVKLFDGFVPPSIEISSDQGTAIVSVDYSIRVYHRKYFEYESVSKCPCFHFVRK